MQQRKKQDQGQSAQQSVAQEALAVDMDQLAELAGLYLYEEEKESIEKELSQMLALVEGIKTLDAIAFLPDTSVIPIQNCFREDIPKSSLGRDELLQNAPKQQEGCFYMPQAVQWEENKWEKM